MPWANERVPERQTRYKLRVGSLRFDLAWRSPGAFVNQRHRVSRPVRTGVALLMLLAGIPAGDVAAQENGDPEAGKAIYDARCALCHGPAGAGDGALAGNLPVAPSDWTVPDGGLAGLEDQEVFDVIVQGGAAIGKSETMPPNPQLAEAEVWNLVAYVRSLSTDGAREPGAPPTEESEHPAVGGPPLKWGSALDWARAITIGLSVLILVGIVVSLIVFRDRQAEGNALWVHLLSLGIFPLLILPFGNFAVLEEAKQVRFCAACHVVMKPYMDDMHDPGSQSLAAYHYQHRFAPETDCYSCHANYGVHGTFKAKLTGLVDVYRYVTRTYELPIQMRSPYSNVLCLKCHDGAKLFMAQKVHLDGGEVSEELRTGEYPCGLCHSPAHDIPHADRVVIRSSGGP